MFEDFLNHKCDIFHLVEKKKAAGYGIKIGNVMEIEDEPSLVDIPCHFHIGQSNSLRVNQEKPYSAFSGETKLTLPIGTDIRINDIVRDCDTGLKYRADLPNKVQDHHITVTIRREDGLEGAI